MNMFKKNGGFTLVELIVVIAILAILAGIAVPAYSGYIAKAKEAADVQALGPVATAVQGVAVGHGATVTSITVTGDIAADGSGLSFVGLDAQYMNEVMDLLGAVDFSDSFGGATWNGAEWTLN